MIFKSIQSSLIAIVVSVVCIATVVIVSVAINEHESAFAMSSEKGVTGITRALGEQLQEQPISASRQQTLINNFSLYPNIIYAGYLTSNQAESKAIAVSLQYVSRFEKTTIAKAKESIVPFIQNPQAGSYYTDDFLITVSNVTQDANIEDVSAWIVVVSDIRRAMRETRINLLFHLMPYIAVITLFFLILTILLVNRLIRPLLTLCEFTKQVEQTGNYSLRVEQQGSEELLVLQHNINQLMSTISAELSKNQKNTKALMVQQETMTKLANYDSLTGLPNRQFVMDNLKLELTRAKRSEQNIALLFFDLDGFKNINDSLGHETGDKLLIAVAQRVQDVLREGDLVARLGGDEFLIVPDKSTNLNDVDSIDLAKRLLAAFDKPFAVDTIDLQVGLSIGIANADEVDFDLSELIGNADIAMYRSKANGRGTYTVFRPEMSGDNKRKLALSNCMLNAIESGDFAAVYQSKLNAFGNVTGFEALLRWHHPELGAISPDEFIPIAEQGGKIHALTAWIFRQVFSDVAALLAMTREDIKVSINLSAHDLHNQDLYPYIVQLFKEYKVKPKNIEFEVTESALLESFEVSDKFFKKVSLLGCSIALDDFGTGYSSLSYLTQIRVDKLKIDKQFILHLDTSERSRLVTRTIIDLAKRLDLETCAEGVENQFQQNYLLNYGCNEFQGFFYGKPMPLADLQMASLTWAEKFNLQDQPT